MRSSRGEAAEDFSRNVEVVAVTAVVVVAVTVVGSVAAAVVVTEVVSVRRRNQFDIVLRRKPHP